MCAVDCAPGDVVVVTLILCRYGEGGIMGPQDVRGNTTGSAIGLIKFLRKLYQRGETWFVDGPGKSGFFAESAIPTQ